MSFGLKCINVSMKHMADRITLDQFLGECTAATDKMNNLLTAVQLRAGLMLELDAADNKGLREILLSADECAVCSARLQRLTREFQTRS
jgi:hypothetical protein